MTAVRRCARVDRQNAWRSLQRRLLPAPSTAPPERDLAGALPVTARPWLDRGRRPPARPGAFGATVFGASGSRQQLGRSVLRGWQRRNRHRIAPCGERLWQAPDRSANSGTVDGAASPRRRGVRQRRLRLGRRLGRAVGVRRGGYFLLAFRRRDDFARPVAARPSARGSAPGRSSSAACRPDAARRATATGRADRRPRRQARSPCRSSPASPAAAARRRSRAQPGPARSPPAGPAGSPAAREAALRAAAR